MSGSETSRKRHATPNVCEGFERKGEKEPLTAAAFGDGGKRSQGILRRDIL